MMQDIRNKLFKRPISAIDGTLLYFEDETFYLVYAFGSFKNVDEIGKKHRYYNILVEEIMTTNNWEETPLTEAFLTHKHPFLRNVAKKMFKKS